VNGEGVREIINVARAAALPEPKIIVGPGFKKLVISTQTGELRGYGLEDLPTERVKPEPIIVHTLTGLVDYLAANRDGRDLKTVVVHVVDHETVVLASNILGKEIPEREVYVRALFKPLLGTNIPPFAFGQYLDLEAMNIALQALFVPDTDREKVLGIIGNVRDEAVAQYNDDGVTQAVTATNGVMMGKQVPVPNPVTLRPWRTFREIDPQPSSSFVLRLRRGGSGETPKAALFEADGGVWKVNAILSIRSYLESHISERVTDAKVAIIA
jgi:hypothetical protein